MINKVEICGVNTTKLPILSNEEKKELLIEIKNGNKEAREKFVNGNLRLVLSVVQRFSGRAESADDLFQIGCIGLIKAIDNFDIGLNVQFSTYAVPMIIGEIRRYLRDNNSIRVSRSIKDLAYKSLAYKSKFLKENNREPTLEEIAKELEVEPEEISLSLGAIQDPVSLQEPAFNDGTENIFIIDQISDSKNTDEKWTESITIGEAMKKLNKKEKNYQTTYNRLIGNKNVKEIGNISLKADDSPGYTGRTDTPALIEPYFSRRIQNSSMIMVHIPHNADNQCGRQPASHQTVCLPKFRPDAESETTTDGGAGKGR